MMGYQASILLLIIAIILTAIALIATIISYQTLVSSGLVNPSTNVSFDKSILIYLMVVLSIMLIFFSYGLWKVRSSNMGGIIVGIIALLLVIAAVVLTAIAISRTKVNEFPQVVKYLSWIVILLPVAYIFAVISVYMKPQVKTTSITKKLVGAVKDSIKSEQVSDNNDRLVEIDGPTYVKADDLQPVERVIKQRVIAQPQPVQQTQVVEEYTTVRKSPQSRRVVVASPTSNQDYTIDG
jgi:hypothetical protein